MSIFISEINMPGGEGCKLVLQIFPSGEVYDEHGFRLGLTKWAKAIPVPPHGRLIDADALLSQYKGNILTAKTDYAEGLRDVIADVKAAPTIIPADETPKEEEN